MSTATIRVIRVHHYGRPEQLKLEQHPRPEPRAGEVLVRASQSDGWEALSPE